MIDFWPKPNCSWKPHRIGESPTLTKDIPQKPESDEVETLLRIVADKFRTVEANEAFLAATCQMKIEDAKSQLFLINA